MSLFLFCFVGVIASVKDWEIYNQQLVNENVKDICIVWRWQLNKNSLITELTLIKSLYAYSHLYFHITISLPISA